jgi:hypothetical protein
LIKQSQNETDESRQDRYSRQDSSERGEISRHNDKILKEIWGVGQFVVNCRLGLTLRTKHSFRRFLNRNGMVAIFALADGVVVYLYARGMLVGVLTSLSVVTLVAQTLRCGSYCDVGVAY